MTAKNDSEYCSVSDDCHRLLSIHCTTVCQDLGVTLDTVQVTNQKHEVKINILWVNGGKQTNKKSCVTRTGALWFNVSIL